MAETIQNVSSYNTSSTKFRKSLSSNPTLRAKIIYLRNTSQQNHVNRMKKALALKQEQLENENSSISPTKKTEIFEDCKASALNETFEENTTDSDVSGIKNYETTLKTECVSFTSTNKCLKRKNHRLVRTANESEKEVGRGDVFEKAEPIKSGVFETTVCNDSKYEKQAIERSSTMNDQIIKTDGLLLSKLPRMKNQIPNIQNEREQFEFKFDQSARSIKQMTKGLINSAKKVNNEERKETCLLLNSNFNDSSQSKAIHSLSTDSLESCTYKSPGIKVFKMNNQSALGNDFDKSESAYIGSQNLKTKKIHKKQLSSNSPGNTKATKKEIERKLFSRIPVKLTFQENSKSQRIVKPSKRYAPETIENANCRGNIKQIILNCCPGEAKQDDNSKKKISAEEDVPGCMKKTTTEMELSEVNLMHASLPSLVSADKNSVVNMWLNNLSNAPADLLSEEEVSAEIKKETSDPESNASVESNEVYWSLADLTHALDKEVRIQKETLSTEIFSDCIAQNVTVPKKENYTKGIVSKDGVSETRTGNLILPRECLKKNKSNDVAVARYKIAGENTDSAETLKEDSPFSLKTDKNVSQSIKRKGVKIKKLKKLKKPTVKKKSIYSN